MVSYSKYEKFLDLKAIVAIINLFLCFAFILLIPSFEELFKVLAPTKLELYL